jgi:hypothetical protein
VVSYVECCMCLQSQGKEAPDARANFSLLANLVGSQIGVCMSMFVQAVSSAHVALTLFAEGIIVVSAE